MKEIIQITESTPIKEIINKFRNQNYSKHTDWMHSILDEEVPYVVNAMRVFTEQLGEIISKNKRWNAVFFNDHIKFYNCDDEDWHCYYDMNEIDKRYIDLRIDQWLDDQD
jgi:hypothetical protein